MQITVIPVKEGWGRGGGGRRKERVFFSMIDFLCQLDGGACVPPHHLLKTIFHVCQIHTTHSNLVIAFPFSGNPHS